MAPKFILSRSVRISLHIIGLSPNSRYKMIQRVMWTVMMIPFLIFQYWSFLAHIKSAILPEILDELSLCLSNSLLFFKLIVMWFHSRNFNDILMVVIEDWNDRTAIDWIMQNMIHKAVLSSRFAKCMLVSYSTTMILYVASIFVAPENEDQDSVENERILLVHMVFPFEVTNSPVYEIVIILQFVVESFACLMAGMLMALFAALILHVGSQIDRLCGEFNEIVSKKEKEDLCMTALKNLIRRHQRIIRLFEDIEYVFKYISLMQFLSNILVMCFVGVVLVTTLNTEQGPAMMVKFLPYYVGVHIEAFMLCFMGEYLGTKSEEIAQAAYDFVWYEVNTRCSRIVILLIVRSQRRMALTAGKFMEISLETFASMLKASASYMSVLHAMY